MELSNLKDEKLIKLFLSNLEKQTQGAVWITDSENREFPIGPSSIWLLNPQSKEWFFEIRKDRSFSYFNYSDAGQLFKIVPEDKTELLEETLKDWIFSQTGFRPKLVMDWNGEQMSQVKMVLDYGVPYSKQS